MQGRPASGPVSLLRAFVNIRRHVIEPARRRDPADAALQPWEQALLIDHHLSVEVQVGGARRAARMATKSWRDPAVLRFIAIKAEGGLWTANHSVMADADFWQRVREGDDADPLTRHARCVFEEATRCAYINGEPGFINGDKLEDHRTGSAWDKPVYDDGRDFRSARYQVDHATGLLAELSRLAAASRYPVTTNPCGEIALHVTGGYCVISDFAPLLACPAPLDSFPPGEAPAEVAARLTAADLDDPALRSDEAGHQASKVGAIPEVRANLLKFQEEFSSQALGAVLDGRDIGTVICPDAPVKLFVTASPEARAERRYQELRARGVDTIKSRVLAEMAERDRRDSERAAAPLKAAPDAWLLDTTEMDADAAFAAALAFVEGKGFRSAGP
jgi:hypothetical protein